MPESKFMQKLREAEQASIMGRKLATNPKSHSIHTFKNWFVGLLVIGIIFGCCYSCAHFMIKY